MTLSRQPIVAIDGPAGSGKSTVAMRVAQQAGLQFISSGSLYRAVALLALRRGIAATEHDKLVELAASLDIAFSTAPDGTVCTSLGGEDVTAALREPAVGQVASVIATIPALRAQIVARLQEYGRRGGIIMEGRDIQTVVFPHAEIKVFLTASAEERARRRWQELRAAGAGEAYDAVLREVRDRDKRDTERAAAPLRAADDAIAVDTDGKGIDEVVACLVRLVTAWRGDPTRQGDELARAAHCGRAAGEGR